MTLRNNQLEPIRYSRIITISCNNHENNSPKNHWRLLLNNLSLLKIFTTDLVLYHSENLPLLVVIISIPSLPRVILLNSNNSNSPSIDTSVINLYLWNKLYHSCSNNNCFDVFGLFFFLLILQIASPLCWIFFPRWPILSSWHGV